MHITILLVEDSTTISNMLSMVLRQHGYQVITAMDGLEGLFKLAGQEVDLVISDINMPRMDGLAFIRKIRENQEYKDLPIMVLSTESSQADREQGMKAGADRYLTKPISPADLTKEVQNLLKSRL